MNILLVATSSYAGMGPYVSQIINNFKSDNVFTFLIQDKDLYWQRNIKPSIQVRCTIVQYTNNKWHKLFLLIGPPLKILRYFKHLCKEKDIHVIHFLSGDALYYRMISWSLKHYKVFLTVHDAIKHEAQKSLHKMLRQHIIYTKLFKSIEIVNNLITNSHFQYVKLLKKYPAKNIFYHPFPSLVTERIIKGHEVVNELRGINGYILFFGRIERYKGVEILYHAFISSKLRERYKLVIAGAGDLYFQRDQTDVNDVIFINRYISDAEVADLFLHAKCVVYPYISATQSGVLSLSSYFRIPTIVSNIAYFSEQISYYPIANTFKSGSVEDLKNVMAQTLQTDNTQMKIAQKEFYQNEYETKELSQNLLSIYGC